MRCLLFLAPALLVNAFVIDDAGAEAKCLKPGAFCAGIAGPVGKCCKGTNCVYEYPDYATCRGPKKVVVEVDVEIEDTAAKCLSAGTTCSGIAGPTGKCCSGLSCVNESPDHGVCRGPKKFGLLSQPEVNVDAKCLKPGALCAGIAGPTGTCCPPTKCVYDFPDHATCRGIRLADNVDGDFQTEVAAPSCIKNGATCASANGRFLPCCEGWECVRDNPYEPDHGACYKKK